MTAYLPQYISPQGSLTTTDTHLGASLSQCTLAVFCNGFIFNPAVHFLGYQGNLAFTLNSAQEEGRDDPNLLLTLKDATATTIFDGSFNPPTLSTTTYTRSTSFYSVLLSFDTSAHVITVYVNDIAWVLDVDSAGWTAGNVNPVSGASLDGTLSAEAALAQFYAGPSFTDFSVIAHRRLFHYGNNTPVDPSTYPSAPVNLYLLPGDMPDGFLTNHGTGGVWTTSSPVNWAFVDLEYHGAAAVATPIDTAVIIDLNAAGYGTARPGGTLTLTNPIADHGTATISGNLLSYTPNTGYTGLEYVGLDRLVTMPSGFVSPLVWGSGFSWGAGAKIAVGQVAATETSRATTDLVALSYLIEGPINDFQLPVGSMDRPLIQLGVLDTYDDSGNYVNSVATFVEAGPTAQTETDYGDVTNLSDGATIPFVVWGDRIAIATSRIPIPGDFGYLYIPYTKGVNADALVWTSVLVADIGFSSDWFRNQIFPMALAWQGLTNPIAMAFDYDPTSHRFDAYVVSHEGAQKITGLMTLPFANRDPLLIIPDAANQRNWVLHSDVFGTSGYIIYCVSAVDGSTISAQPFTFGAPDVDDALSDGLVNVVSYSIDSVIATPQGFVFRGPMNRFQQSSQQDVSHRKGSFLITLQPDGSSYTVQFLVPDLNDANAVAFLNHNQPSMALGLDDQRTPYLMSYDGYVEGAVLSLPPPPIAVAPDYTFTWTPAFDGDVFFIELSPSDATGRYVYVWADISASTPAHGTLSNSGDGGPNELKYTPDSTYTGTDQFVYRAWVYSGPPNWTQLAFADGTVRFVPPAILPSLSMSELVCIATVITEEQTVSLRWSDTRGASWSNAIVRSLGETGQYDQDISWRRLGQSRDRVYEISWSTPSPEALTGVFVMYDLCST